MPRVLGQIHYTMPIVSEVNTVYQRDDSTSVVFIELHTLLSILCVLMFALQSNVKTKKCLKKIGFIFFKDGVFLSLCLSDTRCTRVSFTTGL